MTVLQVPGPARAWVDRITKRFPFERVISGHFASPIDARPQDFRQAGLSDLVGIGQAGATWLHRAKWATLSKSVDCWLDTPLQPEHGGPLVQGRV